tara:strand:+ start:422 stop:1006 length:585 start_codon:yes stop_codon:yes gene_type:complete
MALSDATRLADFATGVGTDGTLLSVHNVDATGIITATSFSGSGANLTGINSVSLATTAYGLSSQAHTLGGGVITISDTTASTNSTSGALVVSGGVGIAKSLNVGGNVTVGGTLTYEDVTRIDSVGIVTAGGGLYVGRTEGTGTGIGATVHTTGNAVFAGIVTATTLKYGTTSVETAIAAKASTGKAIAMAMVFG